MSFTNLAALIFLNKEIPFPLICAAFYIRSTLYPDYVIVYYWTSTQSTLYSLPLTPLGVPSRVDLCRSKVVKVRMIMIMIDLD